MNIFRLWSVTYMMLGSTRLDFTVLNTTQSESKPAWWSETENITPFIRVLGGVICISVGIMSFVGIPSSWPMFLPVCRSIRLFRGLFFLDQLLRDQIDVESVLANAAGIYSNHRNVRILSAQRSCPIPNGIFQEEMISKHGNVFRKTVVRFVLHQPLGTVLTYTLLLFTLRISVNCTHVFSPTQITLLSPFFVR